MVVPGKLICRVRMAGTYLTVLLTIAALIFGCSVKGPTPTSNPESAPAPSTGCAPTDSPTSIPADSPTPIPTVLPTVAPPYFEAWQNIDDALWLEQNRPALAAAITSLSWVADGIDSSEGPALRAFAHLEALYGEDEAPILLGKGWLEDGLDAYEAMVLQSLEALAGIDEGSALLIIEMPFLDSVEETDAETVGILQTLAALHPDLFQAVVSKAWVPDGLDVNEESVLQSLLALAGRNEGSALLIIEMPFLDSVEETDAKTVDILQILAALHPDLFQVAVSKSWVEDGLDADEVMVLQSLEALAARNEGSALIIIDMAFLDTVDATDIASVHTLVGLGTGQWDLFRAAVTKSWVQDGLDTDEVMVLQSLGTLADTDRESAILIIGMPFLDAVEPADTATVDTLVSLGTDQPELLQAIASKAWVQDGLDSTEEMVLQMLKGLSDGEQAAKLWIATLANYDGPIAFLEGSLGGRYDANSDNAIEHDEMLTAIAEFSADQLSEADIVQVMALYGFSEAIIPIPELRDLMRVSPWYQDGIDEDMYRTESRVVRELQELNNTNPELAAVMSRWAWIFDDPLVVDELIAIEAMSLIDQMAPEVAQHLINLPWIWDGIDNWESAALNDLYSLSADNNIDFAFELATAPWIVDGVTFVEGHFGIDSLMRIANFSEVGRPSPELAREFLSMTGQMPRAHDLYLLFTLGILSRNEPDLFKRLLSEPWFVDGLDDEERVFIVGVLSTAHWDLVLAPFSVQHRVIELPLAGTVNLWAARNGSFSPQQNILAKMEKAVRGSEQFWGLPFPTNQVIVYLSGQSGGNNGIIMVLGTGGGDIEYSRVYRNTAEYYFNLEPVWFSQAGRDIVTSYIENDGEIPHVGFPEYCRDEGFNTHQDLYDQGISQLRQLCWYDIGIHLLFTLRETMGEEAWISALRAFYLAFANEPTNAGVSAGQYRPNSEDVYRVFLQNTPPDLVEEVNDVFRRLDGGPYIDPEN